MLTICLHADIKTSAETTVLTVVPRYSIYEASTIFFALVY